MKQRRIGIYAGTFNPVHAGHITFALQATKAAKLDALYFLPERRPRHKQGVEHFGHRVAMLQRAIVPHPTFSVLELDDVSFSVERTLPKLQRRFPDAQLVFLFGSDAAQYLIEWPLAERLLASSEVVVGVRDEHDKTAVRKTITGWSVQPLALRIFPSYAPTVSSGKIRLALQRREYAHGLLSSVRRYSDRHWLYVSLAHTSPLRNQ